MPSNSLKSIWTPLAESLSLNPEETWHLIHQHYTSNNLPYHNLDHIHHCLREFQHLKSEAQNPIAVELAIWFHDIVYDPKANNNELASANLASSTLQNTVHAKAVHQLIITTTHKTPPTDHDAQLLCDIDLSILGTPPEEYQNYARAIRQEYQWVDDLDYRVGRTQVLQSFLNRPQIFHLSTNRDTLEPQARLNLKNEISTLDPEK